jgi:hypothetical protein
MTTPPLDRSATCDIPAVHAAIASRSALRRERRALYRLAAELLERGSPHRLDIDIIDSPLARHHIGDALAGRTNLVRSALVGINAVATTGCGAHNLRIASRPDANTLLAPAWATIGAELARQHAAGEPPRLLTEADGEHFNSALALIRSGIALARSVSPELSDDLFAHIALVGVINPRCAGRLVSASPRALPGLVLLKAPQSSIEVAEALVHEGAHQKLFDLAITHDLLNVESDRCPPFHPPWTPKGHLWPLEQALAACHAYVCLARFHHDLGSTASTHQLGAESLLLVASERSKILGKWLLDKGDHLGADASRLLDSLIGRRPRNSPAMSSPSGDLAPTDYVIETQLVFRRCGSPGRVLVGRSSSPPQLYWVSDDAAALLKALERKPIDQIIGEFAQRWHVQRFNAAQRLTEILSDLYASGLVTVRDTASDGPPSHYRC